MQRGRRRSPDRRQRRARGQALVEFALILPLFMLVLMAVIEFGFVFNSYLAINFASREASLVAAEAGNVGRADCLILNSIDQSVGSPSNPDAIAEVQVFRMVAGAKTDVTTYTRGGLTSCPMPGGGVLEVPYTIGTNLYPTGSRCNRLAGCTSNPTGVDQIGVEVTYSYAWHTPLGSLFGGANGTTPLVKANVMRMEPVL